MSGECQKLGWVDILVYIYSVFVLYELEQIPLPMMYDVTLNLAKISSCNVSCVRQNIESVTRGVAENLTYCNNIHLRLQTIYCKLVIIVYMTILFGFVHKT